MAASPGTTVESLQTLPRGWEICRTAPDIFYVPELLFGGLVWVLVGSVFRVQPENPLGWVMFVSVFCFIMTFIWLLVFAAGGNKNAVVWATADFAFHGLAAIFYLSASVALAMITTGLQDNAAQDVSRVDIPSVVFSFLATFFYFSHFILSSLRWKTF